MTYRNSSETDSARYLHWKHVVSAMIVVLLLNACRSSVQHRPWGYLRLGPVQGFLKPETFIPQDRLLIRYDSKGFSAMSTSCTYDLTALVQRQEGEKTIWVSEETTSKYSSEGKVLSGPAKADLPYYELIIDTGDTEGVKDTLYVKIGAEKSPDWRLAPPH